ncbi:MAG: hypothetical protein PHP86_01920 [Nevskiales bacterium]|nr:hypothetical protein [Nevskiales bacterium]
MTRITEPAEVVRRVVLALEAAPPDPATLELALGLARRLDAELAGTLVADEALLRAASLPRMTELSAHPALERSLDRSALSRSLRLQAERLRELLARRAPAAGVRWSVSGTQPSLADLVTAPVAGELLVLGRVQRAPWRGEPSHAPAVLLYREGAQRLRAQAMIERVFGAAAAGPASPVWECLPFAGSAQALPALRRRRPRLVMLPADLLVQDRGLLARLLEDLECPVMLQR